MYAGKYFPSPGQTDVLTLPDPDQNGNYPYIPDKQIVGRLDRPYTSEQQRLDLDREKAGVQLGIQDLLFDGSGRRKARDQGQRYSDRSSSRDRESDSPELDFNPYGGGSRRGGHGGSSGGGKSSGFDTASALSQMFGIGGADAGGTTSVGDITEQRNGDIAPRLSAMASALATLTGADVQYAQQAIEKLLGQGKLANDRFSTETQQRIADNANQRDRDLQAGQFQENAARRARDLATFQLITGGRGRGRNPMASPTSDMSDDYSGPRVRLG